MHECMVTLLYRQYNIEVALFKEIYIPMTCSSQHNDRLPRVPSRHVRLKLGPDVDRHVRDWDRQRHRSGELTEIAYAIYRYRYRYR